MGWLDSPLSVHNGKVDAFLDGRFIDLDCIVRLAENYKKAKKDLEKSINYDIHNSRAKIKHQSCAEDYNYKMDLLIKAISKYEEQFKPVLKPCPNE